MRGRYNRGVKLRSLIFAAIAACAACALGCETFGSSKVAEGQLYHSGDGRYDPFFEAVHQQQVETASWSDDRKAARKPIATAANVTPNASESVILDAIRARSQKQAAALAPAVEESKKAELGRAAKLRAAIQKLEELAKKGHAHMDDARNEYDNRGAAKTDDEKSARMRGVRRELGAATEICENLVRDAKRGAADAEAFVEDMQRALEGKGRGARRTDDARRSPDSAGSADSAKPVESGKTADSAKPAAKPPAKPGDAAKPVAKPGESAKHAPKPPTAKPANKPADKPTDKPPDEVFNP